MHIIEHKANFVEAPSKVTCKTHDLLKATSYLTERERMFLAVTTNRIYRNINNELLKCYNVNK